jgi:phosphate transport system substrate-binding protein
LCRSNPIDSITPAGGHLHGKDQQLEALGGPDQNLISVITKGTSGVADSLSAMVLNGQRPLEQKNSTVQASSPAIWEQIVEEMREGFASTGFGSARKRGVKMLKVNGVAPTKENIISGKYPFRRPLFLVIKKNARPEARKFVDFVLSRKGQKLISSYGMPSLADLK